MKTKELRVSKSKSGYSRQSKRLLLVYRQEDGRYSEPRPFTKDQVVAVARELKLKRRVLKMTPPIDQLAAKFMLKQAQKLGWVPPQGEAREPGAESTQKIPDSLRRCPKYFPPVLIDQDPNPEPETLEEIAFVLSGIDPLNREQGQPLRKWLSEPSSRIPTSLYLLQDHLHVLNFPAELEDADFKSRWSEVKTRLSGQASTDNLKLLRVFEKFGQGPIAEELRNPKQKSFFDDIEKHALEILYRLFRRVHRRIEGHYAQQEECKSTPWWTMKFNLFHTGQTAGDTLPSLVEEAVLDMVLKYVRDCHTLGRILRSPILHRSASSDR